MIQDIHFTKDFLERLRDTKKDKTLVPGYLEAPSVTINIKFNPNSSWLHIDTYIGGFSPSVTFSKLS
jgi:hypothetical protein